MTCEVCGVDIDEPSPGCAADHPEREPIGAIVITGTPVDGFQYLGPFVDSAEALGYCEGLAGTDWWIAPLYEPAQR
jgi:hypothetical protein